MPLKVMPSALEAEASLLGTMMIYPRSARIAMEEGLSEDDFYAEANKRIFKAIDSLYQEGAAIDITTTSTRLKDLGTLESVGGFSYLTRLTDAAVTSANTKNYVTMVHDKAIMRNMIETAERIAEEGYAGQTDINEYLDQAEKSILNISHNRKTNDFAASPEIFNNVLVKIQQMAEQKSLITGVETGFRDFDRITHGFQRGDLVILAARPSMGKTAVALNFALQTAEHNRGKGAVAIFSLEMPIEQLGMRLLSAKSRVPGDHIKTGHLSNNEWNAVNEAIVDLKGLKLYMDDTPAVKVSEIFSKCRKLQAEQGLDLVLIDYIQLIASGSNSRDVSRQQEVSDISRSLKALARELKVPVVALSQLSRTVETRQDKRPMLSDLRESGAIEQDADIVLMLFRESYYDEKVKEEAKENNSEQLEVNIAKHRNGETTKFYLAFEANTNACMNYANVSE
ncbi:MAG: replicative DNA helicase [Bulleidia sp.]|nr:replicative DNA helicase [Erysipelotrichaceae bacterium]MDY2780835.1 replicative DNA helicase [Bulleidia sp.]